jgi:uncharacterized protein
MITTSHKKVILAFLLGLIVTTPPVNADVVSDQWKNNIEGYLQQVDANTTAEIVVFIVQSLRGHGIKKDGGEINEIVKLGVYIFNELSLDTPNGPVVGIGKKGKDNGVLVLVAIEEREWRIEIGYGLEGYITDIETNQIAQQYLIPKFTQGKYGEGLYDTVVALSQKIPVESEDLPIRGRYFYENVNVAGTPLWIIVLISVILAVVILAIIILVYLIKKGKIKVKKARSTRGGYQDGSSSRTPSGGRKGGGGRSGGGGAKGKW